MSRYLRFLLWASVWLCLTNCNGQTKNTRQPVENQRIANRQPVGGGCEDCDLMYAAMPASINTTDTSAGWYEKGQKLLLTGIVYQRDGKTPAPNVIIYYWQTDATGYYSPREGMDARGRRHGHLRGWMQTDEQGRYALYTVRPAPYPNDNIPAHIHTAIKEPDIANEYYIDEFVFDDDPLLTTAKRKALENRGGSGILRVLVAGDVQVAEHDIILGLNIPNYPASVAPEKQSGLAIGEDNPSFIPYHAWGPDKGTRTCPVCKYGRYHGLVYFVGNRADWAGIKSWLSFLEKESIQRSHYLKVYFVYGNEAGYSRVIRQAELEKVGKELGLKTLALTYVPSLLDTESEVNLNKINPGVENTFILYRNRRIINKFIDLPATSESFRLVSSTLDASRGNFFHLPGLPHD